MSQCKHTSSPMCQLPSAEGRQVTGICQPEPHPSSCTGSFTQAPKLCQDIQSFTHLLCGASPCHLPRNKHSTLCCSTLMKANKSLPSSAEHVGELSSTTRTASELLCHRWRLLHKSQAGFHAQVGSRAPTHVFPFHVDCTGVALGSKRDTTNTPTREKKKKM